MASVTLTPDQERFVTEAVAQGRYRDASDMVAAGLDLLRQADAERQAFIASLEAAEAEGEREGFLTGDEVHRDMARMIDEMARARA
jgi:putative addiction module CopG family antidote